MTFSVDDIMKLIDCAKKSGLAAFTCGELKFTFDGAIARPSPENEQQNLEHEELRVKDEELERLKLVDPYAFEQLIAQRDLDVGS